MYVQRKLFNHNIKSYVQEIKKVCKSKSTNKAPKVYYMPYLPVYLVASDLVSKLKTDMYGWIQSRIEKIGRFNLPNLLIN